MAFDQKVWFSQIVILDDLEFSKTYGQEMAMFFVFG